MKVKGFRDLPAPESTEDVTDFMKAHRGTKKDLHLIKAQRKILNGEQMLILDVFGKTIKQKKPRHTLRIFCGKDEYITLDFRGEKPQWKEGCLANLIQYYYWSDRGNLIEFSSQDFDVAEKWFKAYGKRNRIDVLTNMKAHQTIDHYQLNIRIRKNQKKWQAERDRMDLAMSYFGKLPKDWDKFSNDVVMDNHNFIFYKLGKTNGVAYCSRCKHDFEIRKKEGEWITRGIGVPVSITGKPKHNHTMICPFCNKETMCKSLGYGTNLIEVQWSCLVETKGENNIKTRYFRHIRDYRDDYRNPKDVCLELIRSVHFPNGQISAEWDMDRHFNRMDWVEPVNRPYYWNPSVYYEPVGGTILYNKDLDADLKDTFLRYSAMGEYLKLNPRPEQYYFVDWYINAYKKRPYIEKLVKVGFGTLAQRVLENQIGELRDGRTISDVLGISRENFLLMRSVSPDPNRTELNIMIGIQNHGYRVNSKELELLFRWSKLDSSMTIDDVLPLREFTTLHKLFKYRSSMPGRSNFKDYFDYIGWLRGLGVDLHSEINLFPKDFVEAHDRRSKEFKEMEDARFKELLAEFNKKLKSQKPTDAEKLVIGGLFIRLPNRIEELDAEGEALHHCVGTYKKKVMNGETKIFFIREEKAPDKPFYTLEWNNGKVVQCRGRNNKNMTSEVKAFVKIFEKKMTEIPKKRRRAS